MLILWGANEFSDQFAGSYRDGVQRMSRAIIVDPCRQAVRVGAPADISATRWRYRSVKRGQVPQHPCFSSASNQRVMLPLLSPSPTRKVSLPQDHVLLRIANTDTAEYAGGEEYSRTNCQHEGHHHMIMSAISSINRIRSVT